MFFIFYRASKSVDLCGVRRVTGAITLHADSMLKCDDYGRCQNDNNACAVFLAGIF